MVRGNNIVTYNMRLILCLSVGVLVLSGTCETDNSTAAEWVLGQVFVTDTVMACMTQDERARNCIVYYQCKLSARFFIDDVICIMDISSNACRRHQEISCTGENIRTIISADEVEESDNSTPNDKNISNPPCGLYNFDRTEFVNNDEFPWTVAVLMKPDSSRFWYRGEYRGVGVLIHPSVVLTGALSVYRDNKELNASAIQCRAGQKDIKNSEAVLYQTRNVAKYILHAEHFTSGIYSLISLLFLDEPFQFNIGNDILTACLSNVRPAYNLDCFSICKKMAYIGRREMSAVALKKVKVRFADIDICKSQMKNQWSEYDIHESLTCGIGDAGGNNYCKGIIGAPILCPVMDGANNIRFSVVAMETFTVTYSRPIVPHLYANMSYLRSWIDDTMQKEGFGTTSYNI